MFLLNFIVAVLISLTSVFQHHLLYHDGIAGTQGRMEILKFMIMYLSNTITKKTIDLVFYTFL